MHIYIFYCQSLFMKFTRGMSFIKAESWARSLLHFMLYFYTLKKDSQKYCINWKSDFARPKLVYEIDPWSLTVLIISQDKHHFFLLPYKARFTSDIFHLSNYEKNNYDRDKICYFKTMQEVETLLSCRERQREMMEPFRIRIWSLASAQ